ncbi:hypothetical protein IU459_32890 [Nocardia amamiensis]|uniref:Uncharacterized protein n=1 Tax=Nocardia amamiensis TaxID=404578 RepID=A0ABS0D0E0_9NOCA|nr:hypothetical protein [Nocardia amamiensis]MBF6302303.1 hypothetical protein [Nocardia amamiensis]
MGTTYTLGQHIRFDGTTWRVNSVRGIPGAQVVDLRDIDGGRHCQSWNAGILADMIRRGW